MTQADTATEIVETMELIVRRLRRAAADELTGMPVTPAQARVIDVLKRSHGPIRVRQVAERLGILPRSATSVLDDLEEARLIRRSPDRRDRRAVLVHLTRSGDALGRELMLRANSAITDRIRTMPGSDQDTLLRVLQDLSETIDQFRPIGSRRASDP